MEHTNLFLYENDAALRADYPNGKVDDVIPGVAYARTTGNEDPTVIYNSKKTVYVVTLNLKNRSGATIGASSTVQTPEAVEGDMIKVNIVAPEVANYKPSILVEKIEVSANTSHDVVYYALTSYTVTVHHMCEGSAITADTTVLVDNVYETESKQVTIVPENIPGYTADTVNLAVSGNMEYTLEYTVTCAQYFFQILGLPSGTLWATYNVGANNPWENGNYYAWGEVEPKSNYSLETYKWYNQNTGEYTKYNQDDYKRYLDQADDVADFTACDEDVSMPSRDAVYELVEECSVYKETLNGVPVARFEGPNGNSIYLPLANFMSGSSQSDEEYCRYWTFVNGMAGGQDESFAYTLAFCPDGTLVEALTDIGDRYFGYFVRPVILGDFGPGVASVNPSETKLANGSEPAKRKVLFKRFANVPAEEEPKDEK